MKKNSFFDVCRRWALVLAIAVLMIAFTALQPSFISGTNLINIVRQTAIMGILAIGLTFVVIAGELDLSFSMVATLVCVLCLKMLINSVNTALSWVIVAVLGMAMGFINGYIVVRLKVPSMLGTIGTQLLYGGIAAWISTGATVWTAKSNPLFNVPGRGVLFGVLPTPVIILIICAGLAIIILDKTILGRRFYAVGGNAVAANHAGINSDKIKWMSFIFMGFFAAVAGLIMASQFLSATPTVGDTYLFPAVIAVYLGSIFLKDGTPNLWGTVVACLLLSVLSNGINMAGLNYWHENTLQGVMMIVAIAFMNLGKKRRE